MEMHSTDNGGKLLRKIDKDHKFSKLVILLEYQNMKIFLQKVSFQIHMKKFL